MMLKSKADPNPFTLKSGTIAATRRIISALITKVKSPKIMILNGKVRRSNKGRIKRLTNPRTKATKSAVQKFFTLTPGRRYAVAAMIAALKIQTASHAKK